MRNKEIYERIAETYLSKPRAHLAEEKGGNGKKNKSARPKNKRWFILLTVINVLILFTVFFWAKNALFNPKRVGHPIPWKDGHGNKSSAAVYLLSGRYPLKLVYDLAPPYFGIKDFSYSLPPLEAAKYKWLKLRVRADNAAKPDSLVKIEIRNKRGEKDAYYLKSISDRWQDFTIALSDFKNIRDWSNIEQIAFIFEDWNLSSKKGIIYVDNIRFSE